MLPVSRESWSPIEWRMDVASSVYVPLLHHDRSEGPGCAGVGLGSYESFPSRVGG